MGKRALAIVAGVAALAVAAPGCGDDEGDASGGAGEARLTEAEWAKQATALCRSERQRIAEQLDAFAATRGDGGDAAAEAMREVVLPGFRVQYEGLRRLWPPRGDEDFLDLMLSKLSRGLENGEEDLQRFFRPKLSRYSEFAEGTLMTEEYGVKGCGSRGRSPEAVYASLQR